MFFEVRYEDLVTDFEGVTTSLLSFLKLEWEPNLCNYQATALERESIDTPSYSQVIKPIYTEASYRWRLYEKYLEKFKPQIEPWLREWDY